MRYRSCRDLFEAARDAARDAQIVGQQLREADSGSAAYGSPSFQPRVKGTHDPDRMGRLAIAAMEREERLSRRLEEDYRLIDAACEVLYGADQTGGGLDFLYSPWVADAIWHHYLGQRTWAEVAGIVCYSTRYVQEQVRAAFEIVDANGYMWTRLGRGDAT